MAPRDARASKQRRGSISQASPPNQTTQDSIEVNTSDKARSKVVAGRTEKAKAKPQDARSHEANQERAYVAASRRSDRSLEARIQSARLASEIHKKRTGKGFKITTEAVLNDAMYEEEDEPRTARLPYSAVSFQNVALEQHYQRVDAQFAAAFGSLPTLLRPPRMPLVPQHMPTPQQQRTMTTMTMNSAPSYGLPPNHGMRQFHERTQSAPNVPLASATSGNSAAPDMPHGLGQRTQSLPVVPPIATNSPTVSVSHRPAGPHTRNSSMSEFPTPPSLTPSVGDGTPPLPGLPTPTFGHDNFDNSANSTLMQHRYRRSSVASMRSDAPLTPQSAMSVISTTPPGHLAAPPKPATEGVNQMASEPQFYPSYVDGSFEHFDNMYNSLSQQALGSDESGSLYLKYALQNENPLIFYQPQAEKPKEFDTEPDPLVNNDHDTFVDWNGGDV
ncbi:hypothetical protein QBC32DRAFT_313122 [Pseudoneurospora amorphoporcata]|uniref:Uncharacterized protein n=1 Tax=Pseudoneurospora amorphoporcata TaxID=241081 RepID=A0AAN6P011_9PEZI|nr:hypothetical protein QBC32DRAFT_313122 [Pseudoneurospora amorphoporcata]